MKISSSACPRLAAPPGGPLVASGGGAAVLRGASPVTGGGDDACSTRACFGGVWSLGRFAEAFRLGTLAVVGGGACSAPARVGRFWSLAVFGLLETLAFGSMGGVVGVPSGGGRGTVALPGAFPITGGGDGACSTLACFGGVWSLKGLEGAGLLAALVGVDNGLLGDGGVVDSDRSRFSTESLCCLAAQEAYPLCCFRGFLRLRPRCFEMSRSKHLRAMKADRAPATALTTSAIESRTTARGGGFLNEK